MLAPWLLALQVGTQGIMQAQEYLAAQAYAIKAAAEPTRFSAEVSIWPALNRPLYRQHPSKKQAPCMQNGCQQWQLLCQACGVPQVRHL